MFEVTNETIVPKAMTRDDIAATTAAFAGAAARAERAGFDCVEIHAAHGYLISQFLTPFENRRTDSYGGTLVNRARFGLDILRAVKAAVPALPIQVQCEPPADLAVLTELRDAGADAIGIHVETLDNDVRRL